MAKPLIGDLSDECSWCGTWYKASSKTCPRCKKPNPDYQDKNQRFHAAPTRKPIPLEKPLVYEDDDPQWQPPER